jgi:hypothetical protein
MTEPVSRKRVAERAAMAATASRADLEQFFKETAKEVLLAFAQNPRLREDDLLRLLERKDLPQEVVREIAAHKEVARSHPLKLALVRHPKTPRLVSLSLMKFLYLFDLVQVSLALTAPADVKQVAEETMLKRLQGIPRGEKIALARRGPGRVAAALLITEDVELIRAALDNPYLSEAHLLKTLSLSNLPPPVVESLAQHAKWSCRYYVRLALVRNPLTPFFRVLTFLPNLPVNDLREVCLDQRMPEQVRNYVLAHCAKRVSRGPHATGTG